MSPPNIPSSINSYKTRLRCSDFYWRAQLHLATALCIICLGITIQTAHCETVQNEAISSEITAEKKKRETSLSALLKEAQISSPALQSIQQNLASIEAEIRSRDLELSPILSSEARLVREDGSNGTIATSDGQRLNGTDKFGEARATLVKPFTTGTELEVSVGHTGQNRGVNDRERNVADWEVRVSQDLWRNAFGRGVTLRHQAEQLELQSQRYAALSDQQSVLLQIEEAYWDLLLANREVEIRTDTVNRSKRLVEWTKERQERFAAEDSDVLQVAALLSERELDLREAQRIQGETENRLRSLVPHLATTALLKDRLALERSRPVGTLVYQSTGEIVSGTPVRLEALAADFRAAQRRLEADRVEDSLLPALDLYAAYGSSGVRNQFTNSWNDAFSSSDANTAEVGMQLSVELDQSSKRQRNNAAKLAAQAERSRAAARALESEFGWKDLLKSQTSLVSQIGDARSLADLQERKVVVERDRFEQGRTTTFQLTTFEVDAAESLLRLARLHALLRKVEARAREFIPPNSVESASSR